MNTTTRIGMIAILLAMFGLTGCGLAVDDSEPDEPTCPGDQVACDSQCVDLQYSDDNCGACGVECASDEYCREGACVLSEPCQPGQCDTGSYCDQESGQCERGCQSDAHCQTDQVCSPETEECRCADGLVQCRSGQCCQPSSGTTRTLSGDYSSLDLALDGSGRAHLVTQTDASEDIDYLVADDEDSFDVESVWLAESPESIPGGQTIAVDPNGEPHIAFLVQGSEGATLYHGSRDGTDWMVDMVAETTDGLAIPSIVAPGPDTLHVAYRSFQPELSYHELSEGSWSSTSIFDAEISGAPQLATDQNGVVNLAFFDPTIGAIRVGEPLDLTEAVEVSAESVTRAPSLAFDSNNDPHLVFWESGSSNMHYARHDGETFAVDVIGDIRAGADPRLALDSEDQPHIVYVYEDSTDVIHAWREAGSWQRALVGTTVEGDTYTSERWVDIEMTEDDVPVIAYVRDDGAVTVRRVEP